MRPLQLYSRCQNASGPMTTGRRKEGAMRRLVTISVVGALVLLGVVGPEVDASAHSSISVSRLQARRGSTSP